MGAVRVCVCVCVCVCMHACTRVRHREELEGKQFCKQSNLHNLTSKGWEKEGIKRSYLLPFSEVILTNVYD